MLTGDGPVPVPAARTERTADGRPRASRYRLSLSPMQLHRSHVGAHKARVVCVSSNTTHITLSHTRGDGRSLRDGFNVISARAGVGGCPPEPFRSGVALHTVAASKRPPYLLNSTSCRRPPFLGRGALPLLPDGTGSNDHLYVTPMGQEQGEKALWGYEPPRGRIPVTKGVRELRTAVRAQSH